ncbi:MAG: 2-amino-4-hydroxy-6-hydroxymethyldihydropteridine diphosphokinase, partial [Spirochaetales bacterium]|nr:2-amino-4-hydroxy-6-hydroxymethyldihydropteridine diphosphokinase [Spirochaetales bacterium]
MTIYIGVGSNINADANIIKALFLLKEIIQVNAASTFYETIPEKGKRQVNYINGVFAAETNMPPAVLRQRLRRIEKKLGRKRGRHIDAYAPRVVDLDILLYGS